MNLQDINILIVDDMQFSRESVRISLQKSGANADNIFTAENALQALKIVEKNKPQVVLVDKMMPKVDGPKLIEKIRHKDEEQNRHSYIILLTADESENALRDAMRSGADHYLYKDAKGDKIINCIEYIDTQYRAKAIMSELEEQEKRQREGKQETSTFDASSNEEIVKSVVSELADNSENVVPQLDIHPRNLSYLIVDDEEFASENIKRVLQKLGIEDIRIARNALEALKLHAKRSADIVIVDYMMPKVDGIKLTQKIRNDDQNRGKMTPVVMVTAAASIKKIEEAITIGVDEYLYKPPSASDLVVRMESAFKKHNPKSQLASFSWINLF